MDRYDRQILALLQTEGRISFTTLAERIALSTSATLRRVQATAPCWTRRSSATRCVPSSK
jgi:AsnC-type helix-turn-helix domain